MLSSLRLLNFKSFAEATISFRQLTVLSGKNNSGKSTVIQALRMNSRAFELKSPFIEGLGAFSEVKSKFSTDDEIRFICHWDKSRVDQTNLRISKNNSNSIEYFPSLAYVGADRWGPRVLLPLPQNVKDQPALGENCEFTYDFIDKLSRCIVPEHLRSEANLGFTLDHQLQAWIGYLSHGTEFSINLDTKRDISHAEFNSFRPTNSGYGLSYTLPILASLLGFSSEAPEKGWDNLWGEEWINDRKNRGVILLIENPEAHLHPAGQTLLGRLIARSARNGVQIIVETHSDHVIDGIRIAVKEGLISNNDVRFNFFKKNSGDEPPEILIPEIDPRGKLSSWPEGFFDQTLINRAQLVTKS